VVVVPYVELFFMTQGHSNEPIIVEHLPANFTHARSMPRERHEERTSSLQRGDDFIEETKPSAVTTTACHIDSLH